MNDEEWTTCPYNRAHRVPRLRIQAHLVKCERHYPPLAICPYNATHRMPKAQFAAHVHDCPSEPPPEPRAPGPRAAPRAKSSGTTDPRAARAPCARPAPQRNCAPAGAPGDEEWDD